MKTILFFSIFSAFAAMSMAQTQQISFASGESNRTLGAGYASLPEWNNQNPAFPVLLTTAPDTILQPVQEVWNVETPSPRFDFSNNRTRLAYPTEVESVFHIPFDSGEDLPQWIELRDVQGRVAGRFSPERADDQFIRIYPGGLAPGIYHIKDPSKFRKEKKTFVMSKK